MVSQDTVGSGTKSLLQDRPDEPFRANSLGQGIDHPKDQKEEIEFSGPSTSSDKGHLRKRQLGEVDEAPEAVTRKSTSNQLDKADFHQQLIGRISKDVSQVETKGLTASMDPTPKVTPANNNGEIGGKTEGPSKTHDLGSSTPISSIHSRLRSVSQPLMSSVVPIPSGKVMDEWSSYGNPSKGSVQNQSLPKGMVRVVDRRYILR